MKLVSNFWLKCFRWYILVAMKTIPLLPSIVHGVNFKQVFQWNVSVGIFQWWWEMFPFSLALFMVSISNKSINKMFLSVYFSGDGTCFPFFWHCSVIINAFFYQWNHRQNGNFNALTINAHFYWGTLSPTKWVFQGGGN
jgi:hypothetical protein